MRKILIIISLLITYAVPYAQRPKAVHHFGNETGVYGYGLVTDGLNVWMTATSEVPEIIIAKYKSGGNCEWSTKIENQSQIMSSALDENGFLWLLSDTNGEEIFYNVTPEGNISSPIRLKDSEKFIIEDFIIMNQTIYICGSYENKYLLAAYSVLGEQRWKVIRDEYTSASGKKISVNEKDLILCGTYIGSATEDSDIFITRFNTAGQQIWSGKIAGTGQELLSDMACLSDGRIVLSGTTTSKQLSIRDVTQNTTSTGTQHALCLMLNADGSYSSMYTAGSTTTGKNTAINTLYISKEDKIYAGGYCMGKVVFNPTGTNRFNLPDKGDKDAFILRLSPESEVLDVKRFGNKTKEEITDMLFTTDQNGTNLFTLTNFREASEYGTRYKTTNLALSGTLPYSLDAIGTENNTVLASYAYSRVFTDISVYTDHITPAEEGVYYQKCIYHRGGSRKVSYELFSGKLPSGMSLSPQGDLWGIPGEQGTFQLSVRGTDEQGNSDISSFVWQVEPSGQVGISTSEHVHPHIFPNPVEKEFILTRNEENSTARIYIFSTQGQLMLEKVLTNSTETINISDFPKGIYLVKCISSADTWSEKLIKQ